MPMVEFIKILGIISPLILMLGFFLGFKIGKGETKSDKVECDHQWRVISVENLEYTVTAPVGQENIVQTKIHCTCKQCFKTTTFLSNGTLDKNQAREIYQFRN